MFKIAIKSESEFNEVMSIAESMGYYRGLEFKYIPKVEVLFLPSNSKHIQWSDKPIESYKSQGKEVSILELKEIAAGRRIDCQVSYKSNIR